MDHEVRRFRQAADRENPHRQGQRRRYSSTLQQQAVEYWDRRHHEGLRTVAAALGVAPWTLHRWTRITPKRVQLRPIKIVEPAPVVSAVPVRITMTADGPRVEGLTVETAARLLMLLR